MTSGNATKSAVAAGYSENTASQIGYRLLRKVQIERAIAERTENDPAILTREERQQFWSAVVRGTGAYARESLRDRLKASELLGRSHGDFIDRRVLQGAFDIEDLFRRPE